MARNPAPRNVTATIAQKDAPERSGWGSVSISDGRDVEMTVVPAKIDVCGSIAVLTELVPSGVRGESNPNHVDRLFQATMTFSDDEILYTGASEHLMATVGVSDMEAVTMWTWSPL